MVEKLLEGSKRYYMWLLFLVALIAACFCVYLYQLFNGLGVTGMSRDVSWGLYISQFTYLVGVAASAVMLVLPTYFHHYQKFKIMIIFGEFMAIAAVIMYIVCRLVPLVTGTYAPPEGEVGSVSASEMLVNFFTVPDFTALWSRKAMLPLIVAAIIFGFAVQWTGEAGAPVARLLSSLTECLMKTVKLITYYAPLGFFGFFAYLVAYYGPQLISDYSRTLLVYYVVCFAYMFLFFPLYARFGGGKGADKVMFSHLFRPAAVSFGTCSSVATIPTNLDEAAETGIHKDIADIVVPMGATMHMDGSSMSAIIKVAFLFGMFGMDFTGGRAIGAILVAIFSSVAMSGIPGGGSVGELVLCTVFFPDQMAVAYPIAIALGNLVDPPATMLNAAGDYVVCYIVSRFIEGKDWLQKQLCKGRKN